jgi:choline dehydrogenase-like flavoprotein
VFIDGKDLPTGSLVEADICIVGGGPAGITLALQYARQSGIKVALIESGGIEFDAETQELAHSDVVGQKYFPMKETRIRVFGGSSISWGGIGGIFTPLDFEKRDWVPHSGWPLSRSDIEDYYERAKVIALMDPDTVDKDPDDAPPAEGTKWSNVLFSPPTRFGKVYRDDIGSATSVTAYLNSTVTKLELHADGRQIEGLQVGCLNGNSYRVKAGTYVLAGGGIENARMLMVSNDVAPNGIGNHHDQLGRYFQEHPRFTDRYRLPKGTPALLRRIQGAAGTLRFSRIALTDEIQKKEKLLNYFANLSFGYVGQDTPQFDALRRIINASRPPWSDSPFYQDIGGGPNEVRWQDMLTIAKRPDQAFISAIGAKFQPAMTRRWLEIQSSVEQLPRSENRLVLVDEKDAFGIPRVKVEWTMHPHEERTYRRGLEIILREMERLEPGISKCRIDDPDPWPDGALGTWHHIGTTRMHDDPKQGIVDADCRVHGIDNLYIAGCSVFPTGSVTAPTLTIVALALRLHEHLVSKSKNRYATLIREHGLSVAAQ